MRSKKSLLSLVLAIALVFSCGAASMFSLAAPDAWLNSGGDALEMASGPVSTFYQYDQSEALNFVSMDSTEESPRSSYFTFDFYNEADDTNVWHEYIVTKARIGELKGNSSATQALLDALIIREGSSPFNGVSFRFEQKAGHTVPNGVYFVPVDVLLESNDLDGCAPLLGTAHVELHVNAGDPNFTLNNKFFFNIPDLKNPGDKLESAPFMVLSPEEQVVSGLELISVDGETAFDKNQYSIKFNMVEGGFNASLTVNPNENGQFKIPDEVELKGTSRARMVHEPFSVSVETFSTDPALNKLLTFSPSKDGHSPTTINRKQSRYCVIAEAVSATEPLGFSYDMVADSLDSFVSTPSNAISNFEDTFYWFEEDKASVSFDADFVLFMGDYSDKLRDNEISWTAKNLTFSTDTTIPGEPWVDVFNSDEAVLDINNPDTYAQEYTFKGYDANDKPLALTELSLLSEDNLPVSNDSNLFTLSNVVFEPNNTSATATLTLKNPDKLVTFPMQPWVMFSTALEGVEEDARTRVQVDYFVSGDEPESFNFVTSGTDRAIDKLTIDTLGSAKLDLVLKGYPNSNKAEIIVESSDSNVVSIVRGERFYSDMTARETISIRSNVAIPAGDFEFLKASLLHFPKVKDGINFKLADNYSQYVSTKIGLYPPSTGGGGGGGGSDSSTGSGSTGSTGSTGATGSTGTKPTSPSVGADGKVDPLKAASDASAAVAKATAQGSAAALTIQNANAISPAAFGAIADAATKAGGKVTVFADSTTTGGAIVGRMYIDPVAASKLPSDIKPGISTDAASVAGVKGIFNTYYTGSMVFANLDQKGSIGMAVDVAIKLDLTGLDTASLNLVMYDEKTNTYAQIDPKTVWIDKAGFLHFTTTQGGTLVVSNGLKAK